MYQRKILITIISILTVYSCNNSKPSSDTESDQHATPIYVSSDQGEEWNTFGVKITGKILSSQTNGDYSVIVTETPPVGEPPLHVHTNEEELFCVLKGTYVFYCGDETFDVKQGDFIKKQTRLHCE